MTDLPFKWDHQKTRPVARPSKHQKLVILLIFFVLFWLLRLKMLKKLFCPNLFLHSFWAEKQSQLSCSFVLIARKEFLCFNYKKIWGKNFFCPVGALSIAITQAQCFNWAVYSPRSRYPSFCPDTETELSTILKTALRRKLVYPNCHLQQILLQILYVLLLNRARQVHCKWWVYKFPFVLKWALPR